MATRALSIPTAVSLPRSTAMPRDRLARIALPVSGLLVVALAVAALGLGLARLPAARVSDGRPVLGDVATSAGVSLASLDPVDPIAPAEMPRSDRPIGGLVFVRCTNLWASNADGSGARRLLTMPGLSSPTISPDGRTIAFFGAGATGTIQLWLAAADGSATRHLGSLASATRPIVGTARGLTWSPAGDQLAFALGPPITARSGRWGIWTFDLQTGTFDRAGVGGSTPFWLARQLLVGGLGGESVAALWGREWPARRLSEAGDVLDVGLGIGWWSGAWQQDVAMLLRSEHGRLLLGWRPNIYRPTRVTTGPPEGYRFDPASRPTVAELAPVAVTLLDESGERDLGIFDPVTERWTIMDYAWDPVWSPAPVAAGPIASVRAFRLASSVLWSLRRSDRAALLLEEPVVERLVPFRHPQFTLGTPEPLADGAWSVPAAAFGTDGRGFAVQHLRVVVRPMDGRLAATPSRVGAIDRIATIDDAVDLLRRLLTARVVPPAGLPAGTRLAAYPIGAWSWGGTTQGQLSVIAPGLGELTFHYGSSGFGCGAAPVPLALETGTRAISTDPAQGLDWNTIAWPAAPTDTSGAFGISGELPVSTLAALAAEMDRERLARRGPGSAGGTSTRGG
jgi:hypothetical protein